MRRTTALTLTAGLLLATASCAAETQPLTDQETPAAPASTGNGTDSANSANDDLGTVSVGTVSVGTVSVGTVSAGAEEYRGFVLDNVLHSPSDGDVHFNLYVPESYDGSEPFELYLTLPGYQGLYFQGVGENLRSEDFAFEAQDYADQMIIVAPQLNDWGETSADQTIALTTYLLDAYNIDASRVFANGYSGGGETMSTVMGKRPDLFTAYLHCASQWDGDHATLAEQRTPVRLVVGENDEYYGSQPSREAYAQLHALYEAQGLTDEQIDQILMLDVKPDSYFASRGVTNQHGQGGGLFARDEQIMGWLFDR